MLGHRVLRRPFHLLEFWGGLVVSGRSNRHWLRPGRRYPLFLQQNSDFRMITSHSKMQQSSICPTDSDNAPGIRVHLERQVAMNFELTSAGDGLDRRSEALGDKRRFDNGVQFSF